MDKAQLRQELLNYRDCADDPATKKLSWPSIASAIEEETGVRVNPERLRKFVMGEPRTDKKGEKYRHYPELNQDTIEAAATFLKSEYEQNSGMPPPLELMDILDKGINEQRQINPKSLEGRFMGILTDYGQSSISLEFEQSDFLNLIHVRAFRSGENSRDYFNGWAFLSPEDNILVFLKSSNNDENLYFNALGYDNSIYSENPAQAIIFLVSETPFDGISLNAEYGTELKYLFLEKTQKKLARQTLILDRQHIDFWYSGRGSQ